MIKATIIFGEAAVDRYDDTNKIPSKSWLDNNGGVVEKKEFYTKEEYKAYVEGLSDSAGWSEYNVIKQEETTDDCVYCEEWRDFFADREHIVYCPDCGKPILNLH